MTQETGAVLVGVLGLTVLRFSTTKTYLLYVKAGMRPWLIAAGAFLVLVALARLVTSKRSRAREKGVRGAAWLWWLPVALALVVTPAPLGAFTASRQAPNQLAARDIDALPAPRAGAVDVNIADFVGRVRNYAGTVSNVPVRIEGFVVPSNEDSFLLTRYWMTCCAADAFPLQVRVTGRTTMKRDAWVEVVGRWRAGSGRTGATPPVLDPISVTAIARPSNPYAN